MAEFDALQARWCAEGRTHVFGIPLFFGRDADGNPFLQRMLNIGLHLDVCTRDNGGLRILPGTHSQGFLSMCFRKPYFVWHRPDPAEICVETEPGDLTVHDGRLWHRVARSTRTGAASLRRSMYLPYLIGPYEPKDERSVTPAYHTLGAWLRGK